MRGRPHPWFNHRVQGVPAHASARCWGAFPASPLRLGCMDSPRRLAPSRRLGGTYFPVLF